MFARALLILLSAILVCRPVPVAADEIAFSLVHAQSRIDIPVSAIVSIEARATISFVNTETQQRREFPSPHVELCYTPDIQKKICRLTRQIVEQPMSLVVDCEVVSRPVVREPLCNMPCVLISTSGDFPEANALAQRLKTGSNRRCPPVS